MTFLLSSHKPHNRGSEDSGREDFKLLVIRKHAENESDDGHLIWRVTIRYLIMQLKILRCNVEICVSVVTGARFSEIHSRFTSR